MITLSQLNRLAQEAYPGEPSTLVRLLCAWSLRDDGDELAAWLSPAAFTLQQLRAALESMMDQPHEEDRKLLQECILKAPNDTVTGWHILQALCDSPGHRITRALVHAGLKLRNLRQTLASRQPEPTPSLLAAHAMEFDSKVGPLLRYGRDLTALAAAGAFDELCDRPEEIDRIVEVLLKRKKGNGVITGQAGVGKTALVELLSARIVTGSVPDALKGVRIFEISMSKVLAGTIYRGQFEQRLEEIMTALKDAAPAILFLDEMHLLWGAGRTMDSAIDAANILKPALGRGEIRVLGATTSEEYHQYIAKDAALARRFEEIRLAESSDAMIHHMVCKQAAVLAEHHQVAIPENVAHKAVELTNRFVPNRFQPDKSVDLLDATGVYCRSAGKSDMTENDLLTVLARQTRQPIAAITGKDRHALRGLVDNLRRRIIGQPEAVEKVAGTLIYRRQDLGSSERNLGTFLFAGETGVGKTELGIAIAAEFFGDEKALLHLDLAEYSQPDSLPKLIGAAPGYINSEKEGRLAEWLHARGSGVILFDEIEKAHPEVHKLLLGLLDNGRITSARGERLDTRQCVIILTTNALTTRSLNQAPLGFGQNIVKPDPIECLANHFPREFLGRLDEVILFNPLGPDDLKEILKLRLAEALKRLAKKQVFLRFDETRLLDHLFTQLARSSGGARGIARLLETLLLQAISRALVLCENDNAHPVLMALEDDYYQTGTVALVSEPEPLD